jgi:nucleoside-diphosphate-sugar epimerase
MARSREPIILRDLKPVRDYCFVMDVARAIAQACAFAPDSLEVFNVGTMRGTSVREVATLLADILGVGRRIEETNERERPRGSEIYELVADNRRARTVLGWKPEVSLEEGLRRTAGAR